MLTIGTSAGELFGLPDEYVTDTSAIIAKKRVGKSNTGAVLGEAMFDAGHHFVAIDPKGDWWGLRADGPGGPGLPIPIFGGLRGDAPLFADSGAAMAHLVYDLQVSCILDVSRLLAPERVRFLTDFARTIYRLHQEHPRPLHLILEEAGDFLPQTMTNVEGIAQCVDAWADVVKMGGGFGLGVTLINQRGADLNKRVLSQIETIIALRTVAELDIKAVAGWLKNGLPKGTSITDVTDTLPALANGEAWIVSPHHGIHARVQMRRRRTFDSGATPSLIAAAERKAPATLADINITAIATQMSDEIERAAEEDPAKLREQIVDLRRQLAARPKAQAETIEVERIVEKPVVPPGMVPLLQSVLHLLDHVTTRVDSTRIAVESQLQELRDEISADVVANIPPQIELPPPPATRSPATSSALKGTAAEWPADLKGGHRRILTVLATYGPMDTKRLALQAQYTAGGGAYNRSLGELRTKGLVGRGAPVALLEGAEASIPADLPPLPRGKALIDFWCNEVGPAHADILRAVIDAHPQPISPADLADVVGAAHGGGAFNRKVGKLRTLQLLRKGSPVRLTPEFAEAIA